MKIKTQHIKFLRDVAKAYLWEKLITTYTYMRKE